MLKIDLLKKELLTARKERDSFKIGILSTIVGNLVSNAKLIDGEKIVTDEEVVSYIKKYVKNLEETLALKETSYGVMELNYVNEFLPKQLSEEELSKIWDEQKFNNIGEFQKHLKNEYLGQYDGKIASQVANQKLKGT